MYTPLYSALLELKNKNQISFHMPGHFDGRGLEGLGNLAELDTTEVPESDNLFFAQGAIASAENAAANFFGAKKTRFLVGGSSSGILAAVGAVCGDGDKIICDRFCHRSFISALIFSGAVPVWVYPELLENGEMWGGIDPDHIEAAIKKNSDAKAVYITSPNYFGFSSDVKRIAEITHEYGMALIVDSAHGAHYGISPSLPPSAISCGADAVITSAHKTLPALTQSAYLHLNRDFPRIESMLKMYQTSSPSYILMASLDYARAYMEERGESLWERHIENVLEIFPEQKEITGKYVKYKDPARILLPFENSPFAAAEELRIKYNISVECSYGGGVVCIASPFVTRNELIKLKTAAEEIRGTNDASEKAVFAPDVLKADTSPRSAFFKETREVPLKNAAGEICAREVLVYPPGVPQIIPGEIITEKSICMIEEIIRKGGEVHGADDGNITVVR